MIETLKNANQKCMQFEKGCKAIDGMGNFAEFVAI